MQELIKITEKEGQQLVSARELHEFLEINSNFTTWFNRMVDYGFNLGSDFIEVWHDSKNGNVTEKEIRSMNANQRSREGISKDYAITIDMAKEISMIQRSEKGKQARQYFINCEKKLKEVAQDQYKELSPELQAIFTLDKKQQAIEGRIDDLEGKMTIDTNLQYKLFELAKSKVLQELGGIDAPAYKELNRKVFAKIWRDYKRIMQVPSYKDTLVKDYEKGLEVLNNWTADKETKFMIIGCNSQINFKEDM